MSKPTLLQLVKMNDEQRKQHKTTDEYSLYQKFMKRYINNHPELKSFKHNLSVKTFTDNEHQIIQELSQKPKRKPESKQEKKAKIQLKIIKLTEQLKILN